MAFHFGHLLSNITYKLLKIIKITISKCLGPLWVGGVPNIPIMKWRKLDLEVTVDKFEFDGNLKWIQVH